MLRREEFQFIPWFESIKAVTEVAKPDEVEDGFAKGCALIRANLHVDVDNIKTEQEWAQLYCQALWLEQWRNRNHAELIASLFGDSKS